MSINVQVSPSPSVNISVGAGGNLLNLTPLGYTLHANTHISGGIDAINHNFLLGLQGGENNQYYHLNSGQYVNLNNIISSTGSYTLRSETGAFYAASNPSGFITGVNLTSYVTTGQTGAFYAASNPSGFITGVDLTSYVTTGQTGAFYAASNPSGFITGVDLTSYVTTGQTGAFYAASNPSGFITGVDLTSYVTTGQTGAFYAASNPSGFITGVDLTSYVTNSQTGAFYAASNPSGFITGVDLSTYSTTQYVTGISGSLQIQVTSLNSQTGSYAQSNQTVYVTGNQIISGAKTFVTGVSISGNVGIGTATPAQKLDVVGAIQTSSNLFVGGSIIYMNQQQALFQGANSLTLGNAAYWTSLRYGHTSTTTHSFLAGNVGIGTTTPSYKLDVNGNANISGNLTISGQYNIYQEIQKAKILAIAYAIAL